MAAIPRSIVLITGANQGIGFEISKKLASEYGYHILMGCRNEQRGVKAAQELKGLGLSVEPINIDVTDDGSIRAAAELVSTKYQRLDVLINNAGIVAEGRKQGQTLREAYEETFDTNLFGVAMVTEAFIPLLQKASCPRLVYMSSSLASITLRTDPPTSGFGYLAYRSSKTALNMLVRHYAFLYADQGWKVNASCPGHVATNLNNYRGKETVESGAINAVRLATLGKDGETGTFSNKNGQLPW
jgi:NAD(P)-dependent dehydrogenase (short-subunit alcohol dehydrogenase family)